MDEQTILAKLTEIFREVFEDDAIVLTRATTAEDIPQWDSMNHITIVVETERRFGIKFRTAEIEELKNVGELADLVAAKLAKGAG